MMNKNYKEQKLLLKLSEKAKEKTCMGMRAAATDKYYGCCVNNQCVEKVSLQTPLKNLETDIDKAEKSIKRDIILIILFFILVFYLLLVIL